MIWKNILWHAVTGAIDITQGSCNKYTLTPIHFSTRVLRLAGKVIRSKFVYASVMAFDNDGTLSCLEEK